MENKVRLLISDIFVDEEQKKNFTYVLAPESEIVNCIGCFSCWIKTPGECVLKDAYSKMGEYLAKSDEVVMISELCYGGASPFVKNVIDRSIPYIHPYFVMKKGEMHHKQRYPKELLISLLFYGNGVKIAEELSTAKLWVSALSDNFYAKVKQCQFLDNINGWEEFL